VTGKYEKAESTVITCEKKCSEFETVQGAVIRVANNRYTNNCAFLIFELTAMFL